MRITRIEINKWINKYTGDQNMTFRIFNAKVINLPKTDPGYSFSSFFPSSLKTPPTGIIWPLGESGDIWESEKEEELANSSHIALRSSTSCWILISECSQHQAGVRSKQMMDGAPTGLSLSSLPSLSPLHPDMSKWFIFGPFPLIDCLYCS